MDFLELAKERYSCRQLSDKKVEKEKLDKIIQAGILALLPLTHNLIRFGL
ncbi:MAG: nitroreductase family protein [Catonella sp.]